MKEDYLWDKTGRDAGIEQLENTLGAFRFQQTAPPAITPAVAVKDPKRHFLIPAFAAAAVFLIVAGWQISTLNSPKLVGDLQIGNKLIRSEKPLLPIVIPADDAEIQPSSPAVPKKINSIQKASFRKRIPLRAKNPKSKIQNPKSEVVLTKEEKYAYDQLMLALSITGSKLKLVRDKVEGIEPVEIVVEKNSDPKRRN